MEEDIVKIGIAGCGWIAENAHIPALRKISYAKITAVFDTNKVIK
jgi:predicted dehydrogenase